jgi:CRISPR-associated protein Cas6
MIEMTDVTFALHGRELPANHALALWREVARVLPWLEGEEHAGILPLRAPEHGDDLLLPRRTRLVLRVPARLCRQAQQLSGHVLDVGGHALSIGEARERALLPSPTLHAQLVASTGPEADFLALMAGELLGMGIAGKLICGKRYMLAGSAGKIAGYSLVVHELKPQESLCLQCSGLGGERHFGCGIFIPYKVIANLDGQAE